MIDIMEIKILGPAIRQGSEQGRQHMVRIGSPETIDSSQLEKILS